MLPLDQWIGQRICEGKALSRETLERWQWESLQATISHACKNAPFYRESKKAYEDFLKEEDPCRGRQAFSQLPFTTPQDLSERGEDMICVPHSQVSRIVTLQTGGSSGIPKRVYFTEQDQELTVDFFDHGMRLMVEKGDHLVILMPYETPGSVGDLLSRGVRRIGASVTCLGLLREGQPAPEQTEPEHIETENAQGVTYAQAIQRISDLHQDPDLHPNSGPRQESDLNQDSGPRQESDLHQDSNRLSNSDLHPNLDPRQDSDLHSNSGPRQESNLHPNSERNRIVLVGIPIQIERLMSLAPELPVDRVLLSADYVAPKLVDALRRRWHCQVFEHYGMTEMGLGGAVSCGRGEGYHIRENDLLVEIIDPETGGRLADGNWGEVVFTTLTRRGMPLIRYRTGDISRILKDPCPCGSVLRRLDRVRARGYKKGWV